MAFLNTYRWLGCRPKHNEGWRSDLANVCSPAWGTMFPVTYPRPACSQMLPWGTRAHEHFRDPDIQTWKEGGRRVDGGARGKEMPRKAGDRRQPVSKSVLLSLIWGCFLPRPMLCWHFFWLEDKPGLTVWFKFSKRILSRWAKYGQADTSGQFPIVWNEMSKSLRNYIDYLYFGIGFYFWSWFIKLFGIKTHLPQFSRENRA